MWIEYKILDFYILHQFLLVFVAWNWMTACAIILSFDMSQKSSKWMEHLKPVTYFKFQDIFLCLCWYECAPLVYWIVRVISQPSVRARNLALRQWELIYEIWEHISDCILTSFHQWNQKKIWNKLKYLKIFGCFMRDLAWGFPDSNLLTYYNSILNG